MVAASGDGKVMKQVRSTVKTGNIGLNNSLEFDSDSLRHHEGNSDTIIRNSTSNCFLSLCTLI